MTDDKAQADGYYDENASTATEDFDFSFLDDDEPKK